MWRRGGDLCSRRADGEEEKLAWGLCVGTLAALMSSIPERFDNVTAVAKANVYFEGRVVSHSLIFPDGSKRTLGLIYPGKFHFGTEKPERMEIVAGTCTVRIDGQTQDESYGEGQSFDVPGSSGFDIEVQSGICEYICSFLD